MNLCVNTTRSTKELDLFIMMCRNCTALCKAEISACSQHVPHTKVVAIYITRTRGGVDLTAIADRAVIMDTAMFPLMTTSVTDRAVLPTCKKNGK